MVVGATCACGAEAAVHALGTSDAQGDAADVRATELLEAARCWRPDGVRQQSDTEGLGYVGEVTPGCPFGGVAPADWAPV